MEEVKPFMDGYFLLDNEISHKLYYGHAAKLPIIDYHCHLSPKMIAEDYHFSTITELWLGGDHYKWRAMRANGVDEHYITGDATDREKFQKWAETVPYLFRNPLYHWTHLELRTAFGIKNTLNPQSAQHIYDTCNERLAGDNMSARALMRHYNVESVCTTDDPIDTLEYHQAIADSGFEVKVLPTWRPDKAMAVENPDEYLIYIGKLGEAANVDINSYAALIRALQVRHDYFAAHGCVLADHGLSCFPWQPCTQAEAAQLFDKVLTHKSLSINDVNALKTAILLDLCRMNHAKGWAQQFHFGPMRNVNGRAFRTLGPDTGFDTIGDYRAAEAIASFLNELDSTNQLAKTILYNLNPGDNTWLAAMIANFQDGRTPGKLQLGAGWWFNDHIQGMKNQMNALSEQGLLSRFVGMLTDSRSFVSYPRHEYFRRILCNIIGTDIVTGLIPYSEILRAEQMVEDICYYNAKRYFNF
jgi:glucuronate isomerase